MRKILQRRSREACQVLRNKKARSLTRAQWLTHFSDGLKHNRTVRLLARRGETGPTDNADSLRPFFPLSIATRLFNSSMIFYSMPRFFPDDGWPPRRRSFAAQQKVRLNLFHSHQTLIFFFFTVALSIRRQWTAAYASLGGPMSYVRACASCRCSPIRFAQQALDDRTANPFLNSFPLRRCPDLE